MLAWCICKNSHYNTLYTIYINITNLNGTELLIDKNLRQFRIMMLQDSALESSSIIKSQLRKEYLDLTSCFLRLTFHKGEY